LTNGFSDPENLYNDGLKKRKKISMITNIENIENFDLKFGWEGGGKRSKKLTKFFLDPENLCGHTR